MTDEEPRGEHRKPVELSASSAVILGLLDQGGPKTIYDLSAAVSVTVGFFWSIPNSQMYAEAKRLEAAGYLDVVQEETGRRRRFLHLTDTGRQALADWFRSPTDHQVEIRDTGLLKLFFSDSDGQPDVGMLAADRLAYHRSRLELYLQLLEAQREADPTSRTWSHRPVEMGVAYERMAVEYWEDVAADAERAVD